MEMRKSSRHAKITGDFGEAVVLYWLSKYGFECTNVDHTGIDIIARNPHPRGNGELMGISVRSRSRYKGTGATSVSCPDFNKVKKACKAFGCIPYCAFVVDDEDANAIRGFVVPMKHLLKRYAKGKTIVTWKMSAMDRVKYAKDPKVKAFVFETATPRWWGSNRNRTKRR
jgi:Holliday junction resolvase-like predicted endonuclease